MYFLSSQETVEAPAVWPLASGPGPADPRSQPFPSPKCPVLALINSRIPTLQVMIKFLNTKGCSHKITSKCKNKITLKRKIIQTDSILDR